LVAAAPARQSLCLLEACLGSIRRRSSGRSLATPCRYPGSTSPTLCARASAQTSGNITVAVRPELVVLVLNTRVRSMLLFSGRSLATPCRYPGSTSSAPCPSCLYANLWQYHCRGTSEARRPRHLGSSDVVSRVKDSLAHAVHRVDSTTTLASCFVPDSINTFQHCCRFVQSSFSSTTGLIRRRSSGQRHLQSPKPSGVRSHYSTTSSCEALVLGPGNRRGGWPGTRDQSLSQHCLPQAQDQDEAGPRSRQSNR
jgi:hypothetical protein